MLLTEGAARLMLPVNVIRKTRSVGIVPVGQVRAVMVYALVVGWAVGSGRGEARVCGWVDQCSAGCAFEKQPEQVKHRNLPDSLPGLRSHRPPSLLLPPAAIP